MKIASSLAPTTIARSARALPAWFSLSATPINTAVEGEAGGEVTVEDSVYDIYDPADILWEARVDLFPSYPPVFPAVSFESSNEGVATVNSLGRVTRVADGTVTITATAGGVSRSIDVEVALEENTAENIWKRWADGSLAKHASEAIDNRLADKSAAVALKIFATQNHAAQSYVRNSSAWCADLVEKLTCLSPWNSTGGNRRAGVLITPRHILFAAHYEIGNNATVRFVAADGTVVNRTMTHKRRHPDYSHYYPDLTVGVLDSDLPETITPCELPPSDLTDYLPTLNRGIPALCLDYEEKALVSDFTSSGSHNFFRFPTDAKRLEFYEDKIVGDSGNPAFLIVNGKLVLLTVWTWGGGGAGTNVANHIDDINQMIADVDALAEIETGYEVSVADLSEFALE